MAQVVSTPFSRPASEIDPSAATPTSVPYELTLRDNQDVAVDIWIHRENETPDGKALLGAVITARDSYGGPETGTLEVFGEDGRRIARGKVVRTSQTTIDYPSHNPDRIGFADGETRYVYEMSGIEPTSNVAVGERTSCLLVFSPGKRLWLLNSAVTWHED